MVATTGRTRRLTAEGLNQRLRVDAEARLAYYANHPELIDQRLRELDEEWDLDRAIEVEAGAVVFVGAFFGITLSRKWLVLSAFASGMLLLRNLQGGYPWLPLFRRAGLRTAREIAQERYALKALRGDFKNVKEGAGHSQAQEAFQAADPVPRFQESTAMAEI